MLFGRDKYANKYTLAGRASVMGMWFCCDYRRAVERCADDRATILSTDEIPVTGIQASRGEEALLFAASFVTEQAGVGADPELMQWQH